MSFHRLLEHDRGSIFLLNLHAAWKEATLPAALLEETLAGVHGLAARLPVGYDGDILMKALSELFLHEHRATKHQLAGLETPDPDIRLVAVRPLEDMVPLFERMLRQAPDDVLIKLENAVADGADAGAMTGAAEAFNAMAMGLPFLTVGRRWGIFWGTHRADFQKIDSEVNAMGGDADALAREVRDRLGLVQYGPDSRNRPQHLFALEASCALGDITDHLVKARRPTALDGFDNHRFKQERPSASPEMKGCGFTVSLAGGHYGVGAPECVSSEISISYFQCRYLGKLDTHALGKDPDFVKYLAGANSIADLASALDRRAPP